MLEARLFTHIEDAPVYSQQKRDSGADTHPIRDQTRDGNVLVLEARMFIQIEGEAVCSYRNSNAPIRVNRRAWFLIWRAPGYGDRGARPDLQDTPV